MFFVVGLLVFFLKSSSFCRENEIFENKKAKKRKKMDHFLTLKRAKIGPLFNFTAYIYIYIYMHAVESITGPSLAVFKVNDWAKFVKKNSFCKKTL